MNKVLILVLCAAVLSCQRTIFIKNKNCLPNGHSCQLESDNQALLELKIDKQAQIKDKSYQIELIVLKKLDIKKIEAELIGMNMTMPESKFSFSKVGPGVYKTQVIPGICTESKMLWRLKISLVLSDESKYYTFIDYQVGR